MIINLINEFRKKTMTISKIEKLFKKLSEEEKNRIIDFLFDNYTELDKNLYDFAKENTQEIINILSKESYYKESLIKYLQEKNMRKIIFDENISLIRKMEVEKKEDFIFILNKLQCVDFFILNCLKFDYDIKEKEILVNEFFYMPYIKLNIEKVKLINEKTNVLSIFLTLDIENDFNQDRFNFFVNNIKYVKDNRLKCSIIYDNFFNTDSQYNYKLYLEFINKNKDLIELFNNYIRKEAKYYSEIRQNQMLELIGLAEKLIMEEEINSF